MAACVGRVLLTGASGGVGSRLRRLLKPHCGELLLSDLQAPADLAADERFVAADLANKQQVEAAVMGADAIVHLGGYSVEGSWDAILNANIIGTYNVFEAARKAGVRRIVFASSNHVVGFYPRDQTIDTNVLVRPDSRYGVSKAFGEALGAYYADKFGIGVLCIRIGNVDDQPIDERRLSIWLDPNDLVALIRIGIEQPKLHFDVVYGMSDNARAWWDNRRATELGYRPQGQAEVFAATVLAAQQHLPSDQIADVFQGGAFCSLEMPSTRATAVAAVESSRLLPPAD
jgi:uronate dehydrogenase